MSHKSRWGFFFAFGTLPAAAAVAVLFAYVMTRQDDVEVPIGWPVSTGFWWWLPIGLAISFAISAFFGLASVAEEITPKQCLVLVVAHGINGIVLGLSLRLMVLAFRLIPHGQVPSS